MADMRFYRPIEEAKAALRAKDVALKTMAAEIVAAKTDIARLTRERNAAMAEINGWNRTALAMRDAAIMWEQDGKNRSDEIQRMYFNAAMRLGFVESDAFKSP